MTNFQINCHFKALKVYEQYCFKFFILVLSIIGGLNAKTAQEKAKPFTHKRVDTPFQIQTDFDRSGFDFVAKLIATNFCV